MSRLLEATDARAVERLLSPERLSRLQRLTGSTAVAIDLHQETLRLSGRLMCVIAGLEISLRNVADEALTAYFGTPTWLTQPPAPFQWKKLENDAARNALSSAQRSEYAKLTQAEKAALEAKAFPTGRPANTSHLKRAVERRKQIPVSSGKVIAETTFHFWKRLYSGDYDQILWRPTLKRTFPNKGLKRADVAVQLEHVYQARNRLAHHEPVLHRRFTDTVAAIVFVAENLSSKAPSPTTPLMELLREDLDAARAQADALHARLGSFRP